MTDFPFPLSGATLIVGPTQVGKTQLTAHALDIWIEHEGVKDVVILEFAPEVEHGGRVLGGRLDRFTTIPDGAWYGVLDAYAPRSEGKTDEESIALARDNAEQAGRILDNAPEHRAVFVNDATIPLQHESFDPDRLTTYCNREECVVMNAFKGDELGTADPISQREREVVKALRAWADRTVSLE